MYLLVVVLRMNCNTAVSQCPIMSQSDTKDTACTQPEDKRQFYRQFFEFLKVEKGVLK